MEAQVPLLAGERIWNRRWGTASRELKRVNSIALPMIVVTVSQYLLRVTPMFMLGHFGELTLSSASIATSLCNVTGFSLMFGMASALETLCGQAYGAEQYSRVGSFTYASILCQFLVCLPVSVLWIYAERLLVFVGQDPLISAEAGKFCIFLIPSLFPYVVLQSLTRYLQTQSLILPMLCCGLVSLCLQFPLSWAMIFKLNLGSAGGALSVGISYWFNVVLLALYVKHSPTCKKTSTDFSKDVLVTMQEFFRFAVPSAVMVCLEWWSFEIVIMLSGVLPNPQLEASVLSICITLTSLHWHIPYSFGAAASTLVSNELGAGRPEAAKFAFYAVLALSVVEFMLAMKDINLIQPNISVLISAVIPFAVISYLLPLCGDLIRFLIISQASIAIYVCRGVLGYIFSEEMEVVDYVKEMVPLLCLSIVMDSLQATLSGVARGSGWQHIGAYVNLGSYYLVGIPFSLFLGFVMHLKGKGLWTGLVAGATAQSLSLFLITSLTNWEKQARLARERMFG